MFSKMRHWFFVSLIIVAALLMCVENGLCTSYAAVRMVGRQAVWLASNNGMLTPAQITRSVATIDATTGAASAWVPLNVAKLSMAGIAGYALISAGISGMSYTYDKFYAWCNANNYKMDANGMNYKYTGLTGLTGVDNQPGWTDGTTTFQLALENSTDANAARARWGASRPDQWNFVYTNVTCSGGNGGPVVTYDSAKWVCIAATSSYSGATQKAYWLYPASGQGTGTGNGTETTVWAVSGQSDVSTLVNTRLGAGDSTTVDMAKKVLIDVGDAYDGSNYLNSPTIGTSGSSQSRQASNWSNIKTAVNSNISTDQQTALDTSAASSTANSDWATSAGQTTGTTSQTTLQPDDVRAAVQSALVNQGLSNTLIQTAMQNALSNVQISGGLTQSQAQTAFQNALTNAGLDTADLKTAVEQAIKDKYDEQAAAVGALTMPSMNTEELPSTPEKLNLTTVLSAFKSQVESLPFFSFLQGMQVTASGSSQICVSLPGFMGGGGGSYCKSLSDFQSAFDMMGNFLLAMVGVRWTLYLFES